MIRDGDLPTRSKHPLTKLRRDAREHLRKSNVHTRTGNFSEARREAELAVLTIERCENYVRNPSYGGPLE